MNSKFVDSLLAWGNMGVSKTVSNYIINVAVKEQTQNSLGKNVFSVDMHIQPYWKLVLEILLFFLCIQ